MSSGKKGKWPQFNLSGEEWNEIVALDYILTWNYTDNYERDLKRYKKLSNKRWHEVEVKA